MEKYQRLSRKTRNDISDTLGNIIFYHPKPIKTTARRGSEVRPYELLNAFRELGYEVTEVVGLAANRKEAMNRVKRDSYAGVKYQFVYGESSNVPIALNDLSRFPLRPFMDYEFFLFLNQNNIPFGYFYRDVYWKFDVFKKMLPWYQRILSLPFYQLDWIFLRKYVDHLFLPSIKMNQALPSVWSQADISSLPPGADEYFNENQKKSPPTPTTLNCLYVGGISPPLYDLRETVKEISNLPFVDFTICCKEADWTQWGHIYQSIMGENIRVLHKKSTELDQLYADASIFLLVRARHAYLDFAMPVKLMESIGCGVPIMCNSGNEAARYIEENQIGWVIDDPAELSSILLKLHKNRQELNSRVNNVLALRQKNRWIDRARQVADTLTDYKKNLR